MHDDGRVHYLDNLRALAMFAGVVFHASLAYSPLMHSYWPTADRGQSVWVDVAVWFVHLFRMPLFFAIAGFFAARMVSRRGVGGMLSNRAARILLPLVVFWPLVSVSVGWMTRRAALSVEHAPPLLALFRRSGLPLLAPTFSHLWFLHYLMWFYVLIWIVTALEWRFPRERMRSWTPAKAVVAAPFLLGLPLASVSAPTPAPESVLPQLWALTYYGAFFLFGYVLHSHPSILTRLRPLSGALGLASLAAYALFLWLLRRQAGHVALHVLGALLQGCVSVWMTLWFLQAGSAWMNTRIRWLRYLSEGSYWTYLVHLPVVFAVQYLILDWNMAWPAKWAISILVTTAVCMASYQFAVRGTAVGRWLGGRIGGPEAKVLDGGEVVVDEAGAAMGVASGVAAGVGEVRPRR